MNLIETLSAAGASWQIDALRDALSRCDSYTRLPALLEMHAPLLLAGRLSVWLSLLGESWDCCDNISEHLDELAAYLPEQGPLAEMMSGAELRHFESLPQVITIYRGAGKSNRWGACWSLSEDTAKRFPSLPRYWQQTPMLYTATVQKSRILAVKLDRGELEVITLGAEIVRSRRVGRVNFGPENSAA